MTAEMKKFYKSEILLDENEGLEGKTLPNFFEEENDLWKYILASVIIHPAAAFLCWLLVFVLVLLGIHNPLANKPILQNNDIEFVLTQKEEEPINKDTKYRSDRNSKAGGINDPKKVVSLPDPAPVKQASTPAPAPKAPVTKPVQAPPKQVQKPVQKPVQAQKPAQQPKVAQSVQQPKQVAKPSKAAAPVQRPVMKPSTSVPKPQMPKLTTAPQSPFKVAVPNTDAPVGKGFSTSQGTASTGGSTSAGGTGKATGGTSGMPAPQFSTTKTVSKTASGGSANGTAGASGKGGYGTGNMGNPGPGNPNGAPGIDAIKAPQWGPYMRDLEARIKRNWFPPKDDQSKRAVLLFKIGRNGELLSVRVTKSSGSEANDRAAIKAVQMSAPFRALPAEHKEPSVEINFTFDYNVLGASKYR